MERKYQYVIVGFLFVIAFAMLVVAYVNYNGTADGNNYMMDMNNITCKDVSETEPYTVCEVTKYYSNGSILNAYAIWQK